MNNYLKSAGNEWYKKRLNGAMFCVMTAFAVLIARLFYLQVIQGREYQRLSENNCIRLQQIDAPRGLIYDRNGVLMVENRPSFDLSLIAKDARPLKATLKKLSHYLDLPLSELQNRLQRSGTASYQPVLLKQDIGRDALAAIEVHRFELPGVQVEVKPLRCYLKPMEAAHVIGYLSEINARELQEKAYAGCRGGDLIGKFGIEKAFDSLLRGVRGGRQVEVDARGQVVRVLDTVDARPGDNVFLTIDQKLQQTAETLLKGHVGAAVAMDPNNGEILAMASMPTFDPNAFVSGMTRKQWEELSKNPERPLENRAVPGEYPPASTYKIITAMAGLQEGVIEPQTRLYCPGVYKYGDSTFRDWKPSGHGWLNVVGALQQSCDVFFYQVGQRLGVDRLAYYAKACGLGAPTGIEVREAFGLVPTAAWKKRRFGVSWQGGETLSVAIGQGYDLVTPLQMLDVISAVATGGLRYRPHLVRAVVAPDGKRVYVAGKKLIGRLPVSPKNIDVVKKGLWEVVNTPSGTAWRIRDPDIEICGKTGTAQVIGRRRRERESKAERRSVDQRPHAWFVAYAPADHPRIAVSVLIEHGDHGGSVAAPIARALIDDYLKPGSGPQAAGPTSIN